MSGEIPRWLGVEENQWVLVRSYEAGVLVGKLLAIDLPSRTVVLEECYRVWRWEGGLETHALAEKGCAEASRISWASRCCVIAGYCEIKPVSEEALPSLTTPRNHETT